MYPSSFARPSTCPNSIQPNSNSPHHNYHLELRTIDYGTLPYLWLASPSTARLNVISFLVPTYIGQPRYHHARYIYQQRMVSFPFLFSATFLMWTTAAGHIIGYCNDVSVGAGTFGLTYVATYTQFNNLHKSRTPPVRNIPFARRWPHIVRR